MFNFAGKNLTLKLNFLIINLASVLVPGNLRNEWKKEWKAEIFHHWDLLNKWQKSSIKDQLKLFSNTLGCFEDAAWFQQNRIEGSFGEDLKEAFFDLTKKPFFNISAVVIFSLIITTIVVVVTQTEKAFVNPLSLQDSTQLVLIGKITEPGSAPEFSPANFKDVVQKSTTISKFAGFRDYELTVLTPTEPIRTAGAMVTSDFFSVLAVKSLYGSTEEFANSSSEADRKVFLSYSMWRDIFASDNKIIGQDIELSGIKFKVLGVMPADFDFPKGSKLWFRSVEDSPTLTLNPDQKDIRGLSFFSSICRLKSGITIDQVQTEMDQISTELQMQFPLDNRNLKLGVISFNDFLSQDTRLLLTKFLFITFCVFFVLCLNLGKFHSGKFIYRINEDQEGLPKIKKKRNLIQREIFRLTIISILGGCLGNCLILTLPQNLGFNILNSVRLGYRELGISLFFSILAGLLGSLIPALVYLKRLTNYKYKFGEGLEKDQKKYLFIIKFVSFIELSLVFVLLVSSILMISKLLEITRVKPGFNSSNVLSFKVALPEIGFENKRVVASFYADLLEKIKKVRGVNSVSVINDLPLSGESSMLSYRLEGNNQRYLAAYRVVSQDYFQVMEIPFLRGNSFSDLSLSEDNCQVVINEILARSVWGNENPIGKFLLSGDDSAKCQVVGVIGNVKSKGLDSGPIPEIYFSYINFPWNQTTLVVKEAVEFSTVENIKRVIWNKNPGIPVYQIQTLNEIVSNSYFKLKFLTLLISVSTIFTAILFILGYSYPRKIS